MQIQPFSTVFNQDLCMKAKVLSCALCQKALGMLLSCCGRTKENLITSWLVYHFFLTSSAIISSLKTEVAEVGISCFISILFHCNISLGSHVVIPYHKKGRLILDLQRLAVSLSSELFSHVGDLKLLLELVLFLLVSIVPLSQQTGKKDSGT